jgi:hypothetical protein
MKRQDATDRRTYVRAARPIRSGPPRAPKAEAPEAPPAAPAIDEIRPVTAIIAWHGMGQQHRFETLESVARGLAKRQARRTGGDEPEVTARLVQLGEQKLWRAELDLSDEQDGTRAVHVYEAYWAPCTQGKITLAETVKFMIGAGYQGVRYGLWPPLILHRYLFNRWVPFKLHPKLALVYLVLLVGVLSLILVNFTVTAAVSVKALTGPASASSWPSHLLLRDLTIDVGLLAATFGALGTALGLVHRTQKRNRREAITSARQAGVRIGIWALAAMSVLVTIVVGGLVAYHVFVHGWGTPEWAWPGPVRALIARWTPAPLSAANEALLALAVVTWLIAYSGSAVIRWFLLEFVGDAAIYVSSHKLNRFHGTRQAIKTTSLDVARAVYEHGGCDRHILMGHSLGSVIAYDTLNRLIVDDELQEGRLRVAGRTALLLTFGSILDKTAFLFRAQSEFSDVREALASAGQPLISDPAARPRWVNIHSRDDVLSGTLDYYDVPAGPRRRAVEPDLPRRIENLNDPNAWIPILAHDQYWTNELLLDTLAQAVAGPRP